MRHFSRNHHYHDHDGTDEEFDVRALTSTNFTIVLGDEGGQEAGHRRSSARCPVFFSEGMQTIIEVKPHGSFWKVVEATGVEPIFPDRQEAMLYATERMRGRSGEIRILDASGAVEKRTSF
jgi:hypothetical protein